MVRRRSRRPITVVPHLGEGTLSWLPLTEGRKAWYVQDPGKESLIRHKGGFIGSTGYFVKHCDFDSWIEIYRTAGSWSKTTGV